MKVPTIFPKGVKVTVPKSIPSGNSITNGNYTGGKVPTKGKANSYKAGKVPTRK